MSYLTPHLPIWQVLEDLKGEISNMQKMFTKLVRERAADFSPKSPSGSSSRGGHFGRSDALDERSLQRMVSALEERLAPSITRAIAVELDSRGAAAPKCFRLHPMRPLTAPRGPPASSR